MLQTNFVSNARKTAHTNVVTTKYILMNPNKHIYNFWMIVLCFGYSVVQLQMEILAMIICQTRSQLQRNKEIILHLTKKERNMFTGKEVVGSNNAVLSHLFVLKFLALSSNNWISSDVQIKFISGDSLNPKKAGGHSFFVFFNIT